MQICALTQLEFSLDLPREAEQEQDEDDWSRKVNRKDEKVWQQWRKLMVGGETVCADSLKGQE